MLSDCSVEVSESWWQRAQLLLYILSCRALPAFSHVSVRSPEYGAALNAWTTCVSYCLSSQREGLDLLFAEHWLPGLGQFLSPGLPRGPHLTSWLQMHYEGSIRRGPFQMAEGSSPHHRLFLTALWSHNLLSVLTRMAPWILHRYRAMLPSARSPLEHFPYPERRPHPISQAPFACGSRRSHLFPFFIKTSSIRDTLDPSFAGSVGTSVEEARDCASSVITHPANVSRSQVMFSMLWFTSSWVWTLAFVQE